MGKVVGYNLKLRRVGNASSAATSYAQQLRKKLKGLDGGRGIIEMEFQKYLNEGLEEDEVGDDVLG